MRKTFILFCLVCIAFPGKGLAQIYTAEDNPMFSLYKNSVFLEAGGNAIVGSVNYERLLPLRSFSRQTIAVRAGMLPLRQGNEDLLVLPLEVSTFWGHRFVKPEFGFGLTVFNKYTEGQKSAAEFAPVPCLGIRLQKHGSHFFGKFGFTIFILKDQEGMLARQFLPMPGLSLGYSFGKRKNY